MTLRLHIPIKRKRNVQGSISRCERTRCIRDVSDVGDAIMLISGRRLFRHRVIARCPRQLARIRGKPRQRQRSASAIKAAKDPAPLSRCKCMCIASMHPVPAASASAAGIAYDNIHPKNIHHFSQSLQIQFLIYTYEKLKLFQPF